MMRMKKMDAIARTGGALPVLTVGQSFRETSAPRPFPYASDLSKFLEKLALISIVREALPIYLPLKNSEDYITES